MDYEQFLEEVARRGGFGARGEVERAIEATTRALRARLVDDEAEALARGLPEEAARALREGAYEGDFGVDELYRRVGEAEGVARGFGAEHAQAVCEVIAEALDGGTLERLRRHLAGELAALFQAREPAGEPPAPERLGFEEAPGQGTTLASGRPGSGHPLSEAHPERAHEHSVAREENPHGDTKLSSSPGLTQERLGETLATGKPGPTRPVSGAKR
ncbi:MAG: DUF2267 domain-containing protein [Polyangiaceae bacterium]|nr:DUF2267 domain-containing protein [Polyangiaceae bacterium]